MAKAYTERCPVCGTQGRFTDPESDTSWEMICDSSGHTVIWNANEIVTDPEHLKSLYLEPMGGHAV